MKRKFSAALVVILILVGINLTFLAWRIRTPRSALSSGRPASHESNVVKDDLISKAWMRKLRSVALIGELTSPGYATSLLRLNPEQVSMIKQLDEVVREGLHLSYLADAETTGKSAAVPWQKLEDAEKRRVAAIDDARRMVARGILTDQQAACLDQWLWKAQGVNALYRDDVAKFLELTDRQRSELARIQKNHEESSDLLESATGKVVNPAPNDPDHDRIERENKEYYARKKALTREQEEAILGILTLGQRDKWTQATANPLATPDQPQKGTGAGSTSGGKLARSGQPTSRVFRVLQERANEFGLTGEQKTLVDSLEKVTQEGVAWLEFKDSRVDPASGADRKHRAYLPSDPTSEFLKHAEQVALNGILTERQAEQLHDALTRK